MKKSILTLAVFISLMANAQELPKNFNDLVKNIEPQLIGWRHHFHEFPELSNCSFFFNHYGVT